MPYVITDEYCFPDVKINAEQGNGQSDMRDDL